MTFKTNISHKGKTYKLEIESEELVGAKIGDKIKGEDVDVSLAGYELEITGTSDKAGFAGLAEQKGSGLRKVLLTYGRGMKKKPRRGGKKKVGSPRGLRLRKNFRGNEISTDTVQINIKVLKEGDKKFDELVKPKAEPKPEGGAPTTESAEPAKEVKEEPKEEEKKEVQKE